MNLLDIAQTPTTTYDGLGGAEITIAVVGVAIVAIVAVAAFIMSKRNGK